VRSRRSQHTAAHSGPPNWLRESLFIVISAALGFGAAQYGEYRDNRELAARILRNITAEVEHNAAVLRPMVPVHRRWVATLAGADSVGAGRSALDVYFATRPELPRGATSPFPLFRRSAWDAALTGGGLRLIDYDLYDLAADLSEIYRMQEIATDNVDRLAKGALSSVATYDPASRSAATRLLWLSLADIESAEEGLLRLYDQHLPALRAATGGETHPR
jgi:hypothetical protein